MVSLEKKTPTNRSTSVCTYFYQNYHTSSPIYILIFVENWMVLLFQAKQNLCIRMLDAVERYQWYRRGTTKS